MLLGHDNYYTSHMSLLARVRTTWPTLPPMAFGWGVAGNKLSLRGTINFQHNCVIMCYVRSLYRALCFSNIFMKLV